MEEEEEAVAAEVAEEEEEVEQRAGALVERRVDVLQVVLKAAADSKEPDLA